MFHIFIEFNYNLHQHQHRKWIKNSVFVFRYLKSWVEFALSFLDWMSVFLMGWTCGVCGIRSSGLFEEHHTLGKQWSLTSGKPRSWQAILWSRHFLPLKLQSKDNQVSSCTDVAHRQEDKQMQTPSCQGRHYEHLHVRVLTASIFQSGLTPTP